MKTAYERLVESEEGRRELCVEQTITNVTELLCQRLQASGMKRSQLANEMGVTAGRVTQLLDGEANLTLKTIALALAAFGHIMSVSSSPIIRSETESAWTPRSDPGRHVLPASYQFAVRTERSDTEFISEFQHLPAFQG